MAQRFAVLGNCQSSGFSKALAALRPDAQVDSFSYADLGGPEAGAEVAARLPGYDVVFSQPALRERHGALRTDRLAEKLPRLVLYPAITFRGFHPDEISVIHRGRSLLSPSGRSYSLLCVAAFLEGLPASRAEKLYNSYVYGALGYYGEYARSLSFLQQAAGRIGYDLPVADWLQHGPFMHSSVHPKILVLASLAPIALRKAGEEPAPEATHASRIRDSLARLSTFPVYPEIARRIGVAGDTVFLRRGGGGIAEEERRIALPDFVAGSYAMLQEAKGADFDTPVILAAREALRAAGLR